MHSFGHAAYFGLGAYGAALCFKGARPADGSVARARAACSRALGAFVFGWFCVRLSGVYLAMLTLAFAQIVWSVVVSSGTRSPAAATWPRRDLALGLARAQAGLLPAHARLHGGGLRPARSHPARAARPGAARQPRLAGSRRGDRHRRAAPAMAGLRRRRHARRSPPVRCSPSPRSTISPETRSASASRSSGLVMVAARRRAIAVSGPWVGGRALHLAAGHRGAPDRLLAPRSSGTSSYAGAGRWSFRSASPAG